MGSLGKGIDIFNGFLGDLLIASAVFFPLLLISVAIASKSVYVASALTGSISVIFWLFMVPVQAYYHINNEIADVFVLGCESGISYLALFNGLTSIQWILPSMVFVIIMGLLVWLLTSNRISFGKWSGVMFPAIFLVAFPIAIETGLNTDFLNRNASRVSKPFYYVKTSVLCFSETYFKNDPPLTGMPLYQSLLGEESFVIPEQFPLLRNFSPRNCLDSLIGLPIQQRKPDVVLMIVEGLSEPFLGSFKGHNFMPFLTELTEYSIYWENFFATSQSRPGSLPAITGGLPNAENGFSQIPLIPYHFSLFNVLKDNNYHTAYFTGKWTWAYSTDKYLELNIVDDVFDAADFPGDIERNITDYDGSFWGYHDKYLFDFYFEQKESYLDSSPTFDVIQTGSTRWPFPLDSLTYYETRFDQLLENISNTDTVEYFQLFKRHLLSLMFTDDMIHDFIETYITKGSFDNTIFLITGNFTMPDIINAKGIEKYKVPFLIYSPLVKESRRISDVASHADIYESVVGLIASQTNFSFPPYTASIGRDLCAEDATLKPFIPFADNNGQITELYYNGYFLNADKQVFKVENGATMEEVIDKQINLSMTDYLSAYKLVNSTVENGLMPDSLFFESFGYKVLKDTVVTGQRVRDEYRDILHNIPIDNDVHYIDVLLDNPRVALEEVFVVYELRNSNDSILSWGNYGIPENKSGFSVRIVLDDELDINENVWLKVFIWNESPVPYSFDKARTILFKKDNPSGFQSERYDP